MSKKKPQSIYRTTWSSIKSQCDPKALKLCDFGSGLGPALDELSEQLDGLYDLKEVPEKTLKTVQTKFDAIQKKIDEYRQEVMAENAKHPEFGESWRNLNKALENIDEQLVDEVKQFGLKVRTLGNWADKSVFAKREVDGEKLSGVDHSDEVSVLLKKLKPFEDDPHSIMNIVGGKSIGGCFPHSASLAESIQKAGAEIRGAINFVAKKLEADVPDIKLAAQTMKLVERKLLEIDGLLGKSGEPLFKFLKAHVFDEMVNRIRAKAG